MGYFKDKKRKRELQSSIEIADMERQLAQKTAITEAYNIQHDNLLKIKNSGYSNGGASHSESWAKRYNSESLSPKSDIEKNRKTLRERSRDLAMNAPLATAAVNTTRTNVIGAGLIPKPKIDYEFLGITKDEAQSIQNKIKREWSLWAESSMSDACDLNNFYEMQQIAVLDWLNNGEAFAVINYDKPYPNMPYQLRLRLISADRVSSPNSYNGEYSGYDTTLENGNKIMNGIEISKNGKVLAYYISSSFPGEASIQHKWTRIEKRGKRTGNPNILHVMNAERSEQYRGVPMLAPVIKTLKQITRYSEAEIMAAVVNSILAIFVTTEGGEEIESGYSGEDAWAMPKVDKSKEIELGPGTVTYLDKGEKIEAVESKHPSGNFDAFINAFSNQVGAALEISPEVLLKKFTNNFSASKGALNETWRSIKMRRKWFIDDFCQVVYELFICEAVSKGRINAPGFFNDPLIRKAYTNATWNGPAQGCLNPVQEVNAAVSKIEHGLSTHEDECASINGSDFEENIRTLLNENEKLKELGGNDGKD